MPRKVLLPTEGPGLLAAGTRDVLTFLAERELLAGGSDPSLG